MTHSQIAGIMVASGILELDDGEAYVCVEVERASPGPTQGERWTIVLSDHDVANVVEAGSLLALRRRFGPEAEP